MCLVVQLPPAITTARAFTLNSRLPRTYVITTCGAFTGSPACATRTTVAFRRMRVAWWARSSAAKRTGFRQTASTVRGPANASGSSVFLNLAHTDLGFRTDHLLTFRVNPLGPIDHDYSKFYNSALEQLAQLPMAQSAA